MAFNYRDTLTESDLVYPNLVSANIKTNNPKSSSSKSTSLPLPPPPSSVLKNVQDIIDKPLLIPYKFTVEREVLERARKRSEEEKRKKNELLNDGSNNNTDESIEITLSEDEKKRAK